MRPSFDVIRKMEVGSVGVGDDDVCLIAATEDDRVLDDELQAGIRVGAHHDHPRSFAPVRRAGRTPMWRVIDRATCHTNR
jgi:hypothetical protein